LPEEIINIIPSNKRTNLIRWVKANVWHTLEENIIISIFETFKTRYPHGIDYRLWREKIEWKDYLRLNVWDKKFYATCITVNQNLPSEHISLSVFSNLDFWSSKAKKIDIFKCSKISIWDSKFWKSDEIITALNVGGLLDAFLKKVSTY
jgi:hypothetical protein